MEVQEAPAQRSDLEGLLNNRLDRQKETAKKEGQHKTESSLKKKNRTFKS